MERIKLCFESPTLLNNLKSSSEISPVQWLSIEGEELELDVTDWNIYTSSYNAPITNWFVNEESHEMTINPEKDGFVTLDQTFAISMVSQITPKDNLIKYIDSINKLYRDARENNDEQQDNKQSDENPLDKDIE